MSEAFELPHTYESIETDKRRDETHFEKKGRCSKPCAQVIVNVILLVLLLLTIVFGLVVYKSGSERMDEIEASIAKIDLSGETNFTEQKNLSQEMSRIIESLPLWKGFKQHVSKAQKMLTFLLQKVDKRWRCHEQKCYYFGFEKMTWHDARVKCKRLGADLVEIDSEEENTFLSSQRNRVCYTSTDKYRGTESTTADGTPCQRWDYQSPNEHNYTIDQFPDDMLLDAANNCRDPSGEGTLWCYTTSPDNIFGFCNVPKCLVRYWIGAEDINNEGKWTWVSNQQLFTSGQYSNWNDGEPNNFERYCGDGEDCLLIFSSDESYNGRWNDDCCDTKQAYICMKPVFI